MPVSVCLSVTEVNWRIIANLGFKFRSKFTAHCRRGRGGVISTTSRAMLATARPSCLCWYCTHFQLTSMAIAAAAAADAPAIEAVIRRWCITGWQLADQNGRISTSRQKSAMSQRHRFHIKASILCSFRNVSVDFRPPFHGACTNGAIYERLVKILTTEHRFFHFAFFTESDILATWRHFQLIGPILCGHSGPLCHALSLLSLLLLLWTSAL